MDKDGLSSDMKARKITLEQSLLKELFEYKDGQLVWKYKPYNLQHLIGKIAGGLHGSGYRNIKIGTISYPAHRLMWIYHNGSIDENLQIDHINGIKDDNRIENLRLVTAQQNAYNRSRLNAKGYSFDKVNKSWNARIYLNGILKHLGCFSSEEKARTAYLNAMKEHYVL